MMIPKTPDDKHKFFNPLTPELEVGQLWYIKFDDSKKLTIMSIEDVTNKTVKLEFVYVEDSDKCGRYSIDDINFIEICLNKNDIEVYNAWEK